MSKSIVTLAFFMITGICFCQNHINIIPEPAFINPGNDRFTINSGTKIYFGSQNENTGNFLINYLDSVYNVKLTKRDINLVGKSNKKNNAISLMLNTRIRNKSYYELIIDKNFVTISGTEEGIFYGIQTLIQLLPTSVNNNVMKIQTMTIKDSSRFSYRGMHLDVGRHFFPVSYIKKYIDFLALHKLNNFHWHLTEDQGWRIEIKKYPKLTETGSCRKQTLVGAYGNNTFDGKKYCGYYSQEEIKDVVRYASDRYITVIPEIEMPGHSSAALASYPYLGCTKGPYDVIQTWGVFDDVLCAGNDSTFIFLENVLNEMMELFPSKYIHIGGDECPKERWRHCPNCQQRMKVNGLKNENELQSYLIQRVEKYLNSKGKSIIGWDEILEGGLAPNATVMSWRGEEGGIAAAGQKHNVIMTPDFPLYFNYAQSLNEDSITQGGFNSLRSVYEYNPVPKVLSKEESNYILGAQANLWTEYIDNTRKLEYMLFPRIEALSEALWTPAEKKNWNNFQEKLPTVFDRYKLWNVNYSKAYYDIETSVNADKNCISWQLQSNNKNGKIFYAGPDEPELFYEYSSPLLVNKSGEYKAVLRDNNNNDLSGILTQSFSINKATGKKIRLKFAPNSDYAVGGAFSLIDGIQNTSGMTKSAQFLGFLGNPLEVDLDLGADEEINEIVLHVFDQADSWIYPPKTVSFHYSSNGIDFQPINAIPIPTGKGNLIYKAAINIKCRYVRIKAENFGMIPYGMPGANNQAWLFADEIEIR